MWWGVGVVPWRGGGVVVGRGFRGGEGVSCGAHSSVRSLLLSRSALLSEVASAEMSLHAIYLHEVRVRPRLCVPQCPPSCVTPPSPCFWLGIPHSCCQTVCGVEELQPCPLVASATPSVAAAVVLHREPPAQLPHREAARHGGGL